MNLKSLLSFLFLPLILLMGCQGNAPVANQDLHDMPADQSNDDTMQITDEPKIDSIAIGENEIFITDLINLFHYNFEQRYDFGWRYIESPSDSLLEKLTYDEENDLSVYNWVNSPYSSRYSIAFKGYAHSYKKINGNHLFVAYEPREISQAMVYYYTDPSFEVLQTGELASNGGDEGSWFHSYGEFSKNFSVYEFIEVDGFAGDTDAVSKDVFYFD